MVPAKYLLADEWGRTCIPCAHRMQGHTTKASSAQSNTDCFAGNLASRWALCCGRRVFTFARQKADACQLCIAASMLVYRRRSHRVRHACRLLSMDRFSHTIGRRSTRGDGVCRRVRRVRTIRVERARRFSFIEPSTRATTIDCSPTSLCLSPLPLLTRPRTSASTIWCLSSTTSWVATIQAQFSELSDAADVLELIFRRPPVPESFNGTSSESWPVLVVTSKNISSELDAWQHVVRQCMGCDVDTTIAHIIHAPIVQRSLRRPFWAVVRGSPRAIYDNPCVLNVYREIMYSLTV